MLFNLAQQHEQSKSNFKVHHPTLHFQHSLLNNILLISSWLRICQTHLITTCLIWMATPEIDTALALVISRLPSPCHNKRWRTCQFRVAFTARALSRQLSFRFSDPRELWNTWRALAGNFSVFISVYVGFNLGRRLTFLESSVLDWVNYLFSESVGWHCQVCGCGED